MKRDGHWHARINIDEKNEYPLNIPLSGRWQGRWTLEGAGSGQGNPLDIVQSVRSRIEAQRSLLERDLFPKVLARRVRPHHVVRSGAGEALWQDKLAGKPGDLLDLIQAGGRHVTEAKALAAGLSFIEAEAKARRQLAAELAPHAEAVCERYLPGGVKRDGHWRVEHTVLRARDFAVSVQLSGPARGAWRTESGALNGDLLDLIHLRARYDTITGAMAAGRTIRDELVEAHREAQLELRHEWDAHAATALGRGDDCFHTPGYRDLIQRTQDLDERGDLHAALKQRIAEHKAHETAYRPLMRHAADALDHADAREQLHNEQQPQLGGGHPVFNGQYPRWRREADALITKGQAFLDTLDPAQLAETNLLGKVHQITQILERTIDRAHLENINATLLPHAAALCRRYLPDGVERDGQWRARIDQGEHTCSVTVQLSGAERGAWKNETTGKQGAWLCCKPDEGARWSGRITCSP